MLLLMVDIGILIVRSLCMITIVYHVQALSLILKLVALKLLLINRRRHEIGYAKWNMQTLWFTYVAHANKKNF
jgi:hypothetical protein